MFYTFDQNLFSKLDIYQTKTESNQISDSATTSVLDTQEKELSDTLQSLSISPQKPIVSNTLDPVSVLTCTPTPFGPGQASIKQDTLETSKKLTSDVHSEYNDILNNKPTIKILKSFIEKMNKIHLKNVKISGTKDVLIERIKKEFNLN